MIATTIEQSKELVRLGLDPKTADMWLSNRFVYWKSTPMIGVAAEQNQLYTFKWCEMDIPAWSLSALLEVIPRDSALYKIENTYSMHHGWTTENHTNPIGAAYEIVCWLLEQGLIKKGDNDESKD